MRHARILATAGVLTLALLLQAAALGASQTIEGDLTSDSPTMASRLIPNGTPSSCDGPKPFPGDLGGLSRYATHAVTNPDIVPRCVLVRLTADDTTFMQVSAYGESFDPSDLEANYLADAGFGILDGSITMMFWLEGLYTAVIVVNDYGASADASYTLTTFIPDALQACLYAGSLSRVAPLGDTPTCGRGEPIAIEPGNDIYGCLYAGSLSQVGRQFPVNCGRGEPVGMYVGEGGIHACLYAGRLSQLSFDRVPSCGRGEYIPLGAWSLGER